METQEISMEALEQLRAMIGTEIQIETEPHLTEITADAIRHWAYGIGDRNPLWIDPEHWLTVGLPARPAPPSIILGFSKMATGYSGGLPGVHAMYSGSDYTWTRTPVLGDRLHVTVKLEEVIEKQSKFSDRSLIQVTNVAFSEQDNRQALVAEGTSWIIRTGRAAARQRDKHGSLRPHVYSPEELETIYFAVDNEQRTGQRHVDWEGLTEHAEIPVLVKGPLTATDNVMFAMAWGGSFIRAHGFARDYFIKHPQAGVPNSQGVPDFPERVHWDPEYAKSVGVPYAYDYGGQRFAWMGNLVTNWIGDYGYLRRLRVEFRRFNLVGDTTYCRGRIVRKYLDGEARAVDLELWAHDQRNEVTTTGSATVHVQ